MHTKDISSALRAFADLTDFDRSQELYRLAGYLDRGGSETVLARLKRASPSTSYPAGLRNILQSIHSGLRAANANKQASAVAAILHLFAGRPGASLDDFFDQISVSPQQPDLAAARFKTADPVLAERMAKRLGDPSIDARSFRDMLAEISTSKTMATATLALIANYYLGNRRIYRDRKSAVEAIERHFRAKAPEAAMANEITA
jgi:hypothetical protein